MLEDGSWRIEIKSQEKEPDNQRQATQLKLLITELEKYIKALEETKETPET